LKKGAEEAEPERKVAEKLCPQLEMGTITYPTQTSTKEAHERRLKL